MRNIFYTLMCWGIALAPVVAQTVTISDSLCGFTQLQQYQQQHDSLYAERLRQSEKATQQRLAKTTYTKATSTPYLIPVVVHVIHNGEAVGTTNNPSDATIKSMIAKLNDAFQKNGATYGGVAIGIQFQLAIRSPTCGTTTGIDRVNGSSVANYTNGGIAIGTNAGSADEVAIKSLSRWPNTDYMNIWVVNKINGSPYYGGFTYFPEFNSALTDGMVIIGAAVTATNTTVVHEMGHFFNLYHTFHDEASGETACPSLTDCASTGDFICDTEPVTNVPCNTTLNPCTNAPFVVVDASQNYTVQQNYMGYTSCQRLFTQNQKDRMLDALLNFRPSLLTSGALQAPVAGPVAACSVTAANGLSPYYGVSRVLLNDLNVYSNSSEADGAFYIDRTCNQRTTLLRGQSYTLTVAGAFGNYHALKAYLDLNQDGDFNDAGETLLSAVDSMAVATFMPSSAVINLPLRLRIVADNPYGSSPTACALKGTAGNGSGQVEDYTVLIAPRTVTSVASGSWNAPTTWSCNCIPTATDLVAVQTGHTVMINSGLVQASKLQVAGRIEYAAGGRLQLTGN